MVLSRPIQRIPVLWLFLWLTNVVTQKHLCQVQAFVLVVSPKGHTATYTSTAFSRRTILSTSAVSYTDEQEDYEYVEYERLTESEFVMSEWLVGTNWDRSRERIDETWVRLIADEDGKNIAYWGDKSQGKWSLDVASQFLSISKEGIFGKQIWAGVVDDYYYLQGTVRGWTYWQAAAVLGQWQAKQLGVDKDEAGTPPWFEETAEAVDG